MAHNLVVALDEPQLEVVRIAIPSHDFDIFGESSPPSYEEAINPDQPPPSYDSLFGRVKEARVKSGGLCEFFKNVIVLLLGTVACSVVMGVTVIVPISMIVVGIIYLNECPQGEYIPVYLLIGGIFGILKQLLHLSARVREGAAAVTAERVRQSPVQTMLNCFMLGWFIIGSIWVYEKYEPNYDSTQRLYCNKTLYLFAFWLITTVYLLVAAVTVCLCTLTLATLACQNDIDQE